MPFASQAQRRKFYATPSLRKYIPEFEAATGGRKLPERVKPKTKRKSGNYPALAKNLMRRK